MNEEEIVRHAQFVCIADVHIGNHNVLGGTTVNGINDRCDLILNAMNNLAHRFSAHPRGERDGHPTLCIAGDLFDTDKPSPAILAHTMGVIDHLCGAFGGEVHIIPGNHDRTSENESALAPLHFLVPRGSDRGPRLGVSPIAIQGDTIYLSFQSRVSPIQHVRDALQQHADDNHVRRIVMHYGIIDDVTPPWLRNASDALHVDDLTAELKRYPHPLNAFAGNWHDQKSWAYKHPRGKRGVYQCGAFVSTGFDNEGSKTGCAWVEHEDGSVYSLQCNAIDFETVHDVSELLAILMKVTHEADDWPPGVHRKFLRVLLDPAKAGEERGAAMAMLGLYDDRNRATKDISLAYHVRIDFRLRDRDGVSQEQAQAVARASVSGVGEALSAYVDQMQLPPGVERSVVLAEARRLVKLEDA